MNVNWQQIALQYRMSHDEGRTYYYSLLYLRLAREMFPGWRHGNVRRGDPRKSELFRCCWKMLEETAAKGLSPTDREPFIRAQLVIFKANDDPDNPPLVSPNCMVGPKAWARWCVWKGEAEKQRKAEKLVEVRPDYDMTLLALRATRDFLRKQEVETAERVWDALESGDMPRWIRVGQVSAAYVLMSPTAERWLAAKQKTLVEAFGHGVTAWVPRIDDKARDLFRRGFPYEYAGNH